MSDAQNYSWMGVLEFLQKQYRDLEGEKKIWIKERAQQIELIQQLEARVAELTNQNKDLTQRNRRLEDQAVKPEKKSISSNPGHHRMASDVVSAIMHGKSNVRASLHRPKAKSREEQERIIFHRPSRSYGWVSQFDELKLKELRDLREQTGQPAPNEHVASRKLDSVSELKTTPQVPNKKLLSLNTTLKSHFDWVKGIYFVPNDHILVSGAEDGMLKVWNVDSRRLSDMIEPVRTIRAHRHPILCIAGGNQLNDRLVYTAGVEGDIKVWNIPELSVLQATNNWIEDLQVGTWSNHTDAIWSLSHHPTEPLLLSSSADGLVNLWRSNPTSENSRLNKYTYEDQIPSVCAWVNTDFQNFVVAYDNAHINLISTSSNKPHSMRPTPLSPCNTLVTSPTSPLLITGHEDNHIRYYDLQSWVCIKDMVGHTDSISSLSIDSSGNVLFSGGHDGSVRAWDVRKFQCLYEIPAHRKKHDESVNVVMRHPTLPLLASGGADALIKIFNTN